MSLPYVGADEDAPGVVVRRARIQEIRPLAANYAAESDAREDVDEGRAWDAPALPEGGVFWLAEDEDDGTALGYAAGTLRPSGCVVGPVYVEPGARRRGVGNVLLRSIQQWADGTGVPVVEISVAADNEGGLAFLESLGYVPRRVLLSLRPRTGPRRG